MAHTPQSLFCALCAYLRRLQPIKRSLRQPANFHTHITRPRPWPDVPQWQINAIREGRHVTWADRPWAELAPKPKPYDYTPYPPKPRLFIPMTTAALVSERYVIEPSKSGAGYWVLDSWVDASANPAKDRFRRWFGSQHEHEARELVKSLNMELLAIDGPIKGFHIPYWE